jgi:hypothetical protein
VRRHRRPLTLSTTCLLVLSGCAGPATKGSGQPAPLAPATSNVVNATPQHAESRAVGGSHAVHASVGDVTATMRAGTHNPKVNQAWPVQFTVTRGGRPVGASVTYEFLLGSRVLARGSHRIFVGRLSDVAVWPASALGHPLTFRAAIVSETARIDLDYPVQVTR